MEKNCDEDGTVETSYELGHRPVESAYIDILLAHQVSRDSFAALIPQYTI